MKLAHTLAAIKIQRYIRKKFARERFQDWLRVMSKFSFENIERDYDVL
jgi:hypothetical protein